MVEIDRGNRGAGGSLIRHAGRVWRLDAWPGRFEDVEVRGDALVLRMRDGAQRLLEPEDAV